MITPERIAQIRSKPHGPDLDEWMDTLEFLWTEHQMAIEATKAMQLRAREAEEHTAGRELSVLLAAKREWSHRTFGPDFPAWRIVAHIHRELAEIEAAPMDTVEWIDVALLAIDGYWRAGGSDLLADLWAKHRINQARQWQTNGDGVVEHVR